MSWQATSWVIAHSEHKGSALLTLLCIANCANENGSDCWPTFDRLAKDTRMSKRQLMRVIEKLEESGELGVKRSEGRYPNHYSFPLMNSDKMSPLPRRTVTKSRSNSDISRANSDIAMSPITSIERSNKNSQAPAPFSSRRFTEAMVEFQEHRRAMKKPLKQVGLARLYKDLAEWGEDAAIEALHASVRNGWQGVFPPKNGTSPKAGNNGVVRGF